MNTKEQLINNIKEWISIDNDIIKLKNEIKEKNNQKKILSVALVDVMKSNNIDNFDINDGSLIYKKNKTKKPITGKLLLATLQKYYKTEDNLAEEITKFIMDNREENIKEIIKRKINK